MKDMKDHVANFATFVSKTLIFSSQKMGEFNFKLAQYCSYKIYIKTDQVLFLSDFKMDVIKW